MSGTKTGLIFDDRMTEHSCWWDPGKSEMVERYLSSKQKCIDNGLMNRCHLLIPRFSTEQELLTVHEESYINKIKTTMHMTNRTELENFSSQYDGVFLNSKSYECALLAAGCATELVSAVMKRSIRNGLALIRPPGHHAMAGSASGFCIFNNVAIAAKSALENFGLKRILIVDWDVHHGQGIQEIFYNDPRVLYFSIHRYQNGEFWPHLRESNFDFVGGDSAAGFNINVPLNSVGLENADYLAIFNNVLLPIAYEFSPELVLISAGYDAAIGCPEGEMRLGPQVFPHFLNLLSCLGNGRMCVILEGGYCISSLSESVTLTLRGLLGDPCPLLSPCSVLKDSCVKSILNVISALHPFWECLSIQDTYHQFKLTSNKKDKHIPVIAYAGNPFAGVTVFETREDYPVQSLSVIKSFEEEIKELILKTDLSVAEFRTGFVFDPKIDNICKFSDHSEVGDNVLSFYKKLASSGLFSKCLLLHSATADNNELFPETSFQHEMPYLLNLTNDFEKIINEDLNFLQSCDQTSLISTYNKILILVDAVVRKKCTNGFALVRPTCHFKDLNRTSNSLVSSVVIAAKYLLNQQNMNKILIVDLDIKKNDITQNIFYEDDRVLYISLFYDSDYFPGASEVKDKQDENSKGQGYTINIPFFHTIVDGDYLAAFFHVVLPIAYAFRPEFVLISLGFNDYSKESRLTPSCFAVVTKLLSGLSNGKVVLFSEGNFINSESAPDLAAHCLSVLLDENYISLRPAKPKAEGISTVRNVVKTLKNYWKCLAFDVEIPNNFNEILENPTYHIHQRRSSEPVAIPQSLNDIEISNSVNFEIEMCGDDNFFCVTPLENCPHLELLQPIPAEGLNHRAPCLACSDTKENWVCLHCYQVFCGRFVNQHMIQHGLDMNHYLTLSFSDLSVWCYACESYIHNNILFPILEHAQDKKFSVN